MTFYENIHTMCLKLAESGFLPDSFKYTFVVNSIICAFLIGPLLGGVGTMVVARRLAFFSQAVGQAALTGVALGIIIGESVTSPYITLFGFCIIFGILMNYTRNRTKMSSDTVIGVFMSISLAVGASVLLHVTGKINIHLLDNILFGSILTVNARDMNVLISIFLISSLFGILFFNRLLLAGFNPAIAHARGVRIKILEYGFIVMITLITVASLKIVGAVLVEALFIIPAAASRNISRSIKGFVFYSVLISTVSTIAGIIIPMEMDLAIPSGGAIIIAASLFFIITVFIKALTPNPAV